MLNVLLTSLVAFFITFLAIPTIMRIAEQKKLYDIPDARKLHTKPIASLGGVGIFIGFLLSCLLCIALNQHAEFQYYFAAATIIFFLGLKDDILILSPVKKFMVQVLAAAIIIHGAGLQIDSMHGLFGVTSIPFWVGLPLSYISIIVIINAFNLIDGVDGLAGSLGFLTMAVFGAYFTAINQPGYAMLSLAMAGSLVAFLIFNYNPARIFMGDSGSLLLGLVNAILVLKFISVGDTPAVAFRTEAVVAIGFAILIVPLADTLRVFSLRIINGRSPFSPDRNHIHHLLLDRGMKQKYIPLFCVVLNILFVGLAFVTRGLGATYAMLVITTAAFAFLAMLVYLRKPVQAPFVLSPFQKKPKAVLASSTKVVSLASEAVGLEN